MNNSKTLKSLLKHLNLDYFILPNEDEFANQYLPEHSKRLQFITNFTGSNAIIIIGEKKSAFFTDGRYSLQAAGEIDDDFYTIYNLSDQTPWQWLKENTKPGDRIGFDGKLHSKNNIAIYQKYLGDKKLEFTFLKTNPVDALWKARLTLPDSEVFIHQLKYCGLTWAEKCQNICADFKEHADILVLNNVESICWLLNIRASDIDYTPLALSYAILHKNGEVELFIDEKRLSKKVKKHLENIKILPPQQLEKYCLSLKKSSIKTAQIDPESCNYWLYNLLSDSLNIIEKPDPCIIHKAIKNKTEIQGAIKAHEIDGLALTKFLFWLTQAEQKKLPLDEISAAEKLLEFRKLNPDFIYPSFATISGFGSNGAIIHYHPTQKTNKKFKGNSLYLVDSGGQYFFGTTDVTRTILFGKASEEQIRNFTLVLKGHINFARAKFPLGTSGNNLDIVARYHLWQDHKDYDHGTGHGVSNFLAVHEGPQSTGKRANNIVLQPGMILSDEPGYYEPGQYGIRIENLLLVEKFSPGKLSSTKQFLQFRNLTLAPIDHNLIDFKMLTYPERKWLKNYHAEIYKKLKSGLNAQEKIWLEKIIAVYQSNL